MDPPKAKRVKCHTTVWPVIWPISLPRTGIAHCAPSCLAFTRVLRTHKYVTSAVHFLSLHRRNLKNKLSLPFTFKSLKKVVEFHRKHRGKVEVVKKNTLVSFSLFLYQTLGVCWSFLPFNLWPHQKPRVLKTELQSWFWLLA